MASICVFAGSTKKVRKGFYEAASALGDIISKRGHTLVYGGSKRGLMGATAISALSNDGKIVEVMPEVFANAAIGKCRVIVTKNFRDRKKVMWDISDGFIALPGGFGTLDEIADVIAENLLANEERRSMKPLVVLNTDGFYADLLRHFERIYDENLAPQDNKNVYSITPSPHKAVVLIEQYKPLTLELRVKHIEA